jgi:CBS domain containing-hemolysin-like protein
VLESPAKLDDYVAACQIGITASSLVLGFYGQRALRPPVVEALGGAGLAAELGAASAATALVLLLLTALQLIFGELVPKSLALRFPERLALATTYPMLLSLRLFHPIIVLFNGSGALLLRLLGLSTAPAHAHIHSPEEIAALVAESAQGGVIDPFERQMIHNAFDLSQLVARQVMIPRNRVELADVDAAPEELLRRLATSPFSRIPVYEDNPDRILGIVHLKDLFRLQVSGRGSVAEVVRPTPFVPETLPVADLWALLNRGQHYLAVVIDEYGGTAGIVTQEDLLEEIVGEVQDEFDIESDPIVRPPKGPPLVRGDLLVSEVNDALGIALPTTDADTLGGLIMHHLGRTAQPGDEVVVADVRLHVVALRGHSIERVAVSRVGAAGPGAPPA